MTYEMEKLAENLEKSPEISTETTPEVAASNAHCEENATPSALRDKYRFVRLLGKGTQGRVYEAERLSDGEHVAIKVLDIHSIQNWKEYELFWREAKTLQALRIDGVARFYEAMEDLNPEHPCAYLVQQYIHGKPLSDMLRDGTHFGMTDIFSYAAQIMEILQALHRHEPPIIHRDIKPSNIMLEPDGRGYRVYLTDFGAVCNPMVQKGGSTVAGTFGYMPPEQLMGKVCAASDIYALGVTLAELLSGVSPADMEIADLRLVIEKPLANAPYPVVSLLRGMTNPQVEERYCDHGALVESFRNFARGEFSHGANLAQTQSLSLWSASLKSIHRLGQRESLSLWLALPEQTPRAIPDCYKKLYVYEDLGFLNFFKRIVLIVVNPLNVLRIPGKYLLACCIVLLCLALFPGVFSMLLLIFILSKAARDESKEATVIRSLLTMGRKALATVVSVDYAGLNPNAVSTALFRVRYTFNPPDDALEADLVHEVSVCNDPLLSPGDAFPILYSIEKTNGKEELVRSMPFPFPIPRIAPSNCYCTTRQGVIISNDGKDNRDMN